MNVDVAAVPPLFGERRPLRQRNSHAPVAQFFPGNPAFRDYELVTLDHLVPQGQRMRIHNKIAVDIGEPLGLETHIALLRIWRQLGRMARRNNVVATGVCQSQPGSDGPAGQFVDNLAGNRIPIRRRLRQPAPSRQPHTRARVMEKTPPIPRRHAVILSKKDRAATQGSGERTSSSLRCAGSCVESLTP